MNGWNEEEVEGEDPEESGASVALRTTSLPPILPGGTNATIPGGPPVCILLVRGAEAAASNQTKAADAEEAVVRERSITSGSIIVTRTSR